MKTSSCRDQYNYRKQKQQHQPRGSCKSLCCGCRLSVSSSEEAESSNHFASSVSRLAHALVQERLDQMIRESGKEARHSGRRSKRTLVDDVHDHRRHHNHQALETKFVVMVAVEKCSFDPREDFRESMIEMVMASGIEEAKDLRSLLNHYLSMNSKEYHGIILEVFYEVCAGLFSN